MITYAVAADNNVTTSANATTTTNVAVENKATTSDIATTADNVAADKHATTGNDATYHATYDVTMNTPVDLKWDVGVTLHQVMCVHSHQQVARIPVLTPAADDMPYNDVMADDITMTPAADDVTILSAADAGMLHADAIVMHPTSAAADDNENVSTTKALMVKIVPDHDDDNDDGQDADSSTDAAISYFQKFDFTGDFSSLVLKDDMPTYNATVDSVTAAISFDEPTYDATAEDNKDTWDGNNSVVNDDNHNDDDENSNIADAAIMYCETFASDGDVVPIHMLLDTYIGNLWTIVNDSILSLHKETYWQDGVIDDMTCGNVMASVDDNYVTITETSAAATIANDTPTVAACTVHMITKANVISITTNTAAVTNDDHTMNAVVHMKADDDVPLDTYVTSINNGIRDTQETYWVLLHLVFFGCLSEEVYQFLIALALRGCPRVAPSLQVPLAPPPCSQPLHNGVTFYQIPMSLPIDCTC